MKILRNGFYRIPSRVIRLSRRKRAIISKGPFEIGKEVIVKVQRFLCRKRTGREMGRSPGVFAADIYP